MTISFNQLGYTGRLGNQLWQVASSYGIARTLNQDLLLPSDWMYRPYYSVPDKYFGDIRDDTVESYDTDLVSHIDPRARVYLQDYNLWKDYESDIHDFFTPSDMAFETVYPEIDKITRLPHPTLSVHIRRGDNVDNPRGYHPLRPLSYYKDAIDLCKKKYGIKSIGVFSDDPEYCKNNIDADFYYEGVTRPKEHEDDFLTAPVLDWIDLELMCHFDNHIIGNSTFAWWGAFLSLDMSPIYPSPWFGSKLQYINAGLMFPPSWEEFKIPMGDWYH